MSDHAQVFRALHRKGDPLILANIWDVASARAAKAEGALAIATSSGALAASLGYPDGQQLPLDDLLRVVERIVRATKLPVSVDFEAGYGAAPRDIEANFARLAGVGAVGANLEDGLVDGERRLADPSRQAERLAAARAGAGAGFFVNARIDTFLLAPPATQAPVPDTVARAQVYAAAGADGVFVPGAATAADIEALCASIALPLNVMAVAGFPNVPALAALGVARVSLGAWPLMSMLGRYRAAYRNLVATGDLADF